MRDLPTQMAHMLTKTVGKYDTHLRGA